ncbi:MAG: hypothetical protein IJT30_08630 [Muribaculaceae bacterium]|nr:hypothetical protein [Muribaculaceae bacterium]
MKRFITLSALVLAMTGLALACGPWARPMYYVFSAYNRQQLGDTFMPRLERFWIDYTGDNTAGYAMQSLAYVDMEHFEESTNCIVRKALDSGDKEMEDYLRVLVAYMQLSKDLDDDNWAYPTKGQQANRNMRMQYLHDRAKSYSGTRLLPQYRLMAMRTLMGKGDTQGIINYWNKAESGLKPSVYKDLMRNIYAGALLRTGKKKEACDIYAEQGDMLSLKWIMRDNRDLNGIRSEYDRDPNAPTLVYLVQDFVNRGNATLRAQYEYDWDNPAYIAASQQEMRQFIAFATQVVREGKTSVPALWQSAAGLLTCNLGDTQQGLDMLDKALKLRGTQRMLDNARVCRWVASAANADGSKKYQDYFLDELKWVQTVEKREIEQYSNYYNNYGFASNHYTEVMQNMMYDIMPVKARQWGNSNLSTALQGWMYQHERLIAGNDLGEDYWVSGDYRCALDSLTSTEMVAYRDYLTAGKRATTALERYLNTGTSPNMTTDYFNDRIGTKLIREGEFEAAIPYLEKVPVSYYGTLAISYYMARRDMEQHRWFKHQVVCHGEWWGECGEERTPVNTNQKLDFCHKALSYQHVIAHPAGAGITAVEARYLLASLLYQASYKGECWYISRYGQSWGDECCYRNEKDFVAWAAQLLDEAATMPNNDFALRQDILYARAYVPSGTRYITRTWDADYNLHETKNTYSREYSTMNDLANFYRTNSRQSASYITRCDILKQFIRGNYTGQWGD